MIEAGEAEDERRIGQTVQEVLAYQAGDDQVLASLFERYYPRVLQIVRSRMGPFLKRRLESSEIVHETLMAAQVNLRRARIAGSGALIHWLAAICENVIRGKIDYFQAQKRDPRFEVELGLLSTVVSSGEFEVGLEAETPSPLQHAESREELRAVVLCLAELSEDQREALLLRRVAGCSLDFVAQEMERSPDAVTKLTARAEARLLELMLLHERVRPAPPTG